MASLTQTAMITRKIIRYSIYFVIFYISARILWKVGSGIYRHFFPPPLPPPTVAFGKLPKLPFPTKDALEGITYTLETPGGGLPLFSEQATVYFMVQPTANLLALDVAKEKAYSLGFLPNGQQLSQTNYRFSHEEHPKSLEMNIVTGFFSVGYDLKTDSSPLQARPIVPEVAAAEARSYLSSADLLPDDLSGRTSHEFLKIEEESLVSAVSLSEAALTKVNLFRKDYNGLPSVTPNPNKANVWFLLSGSRERGKRFIGAEYHYLPVDEYQSSTYPIKTSLQAWEGLINGNGFIASYFGEEKSVIIRRVYLAYYDAGKEINFYQPVVVFEGDNGFFAYIPAIIPDYYGE